MNFVTSIKEMFSAALHWLCSHRRYRLIAVNPCTGGWMYRDSISGRTCLVQSQLTEPGTPLEISESDASAMLNIESGLGWEDVHTADRVYYPNVDELAVCAKTQLVSHGAVLTTVDVG